MTKNKAVLSWLDEMVALNNPDKVIWIDGSNEQADKLREEACSTGEIIKLNQEKLPGCYLHRTAINDVARVENKTFICTKTKEEAGATNNWCDPDEMYTKLRALYKDSMKGRTMYVIHLWVLSVLPLPK
jgi:phosphoenolpyruvate carboxykinase (GTP)